MPIIAPQEPPLRLLLLAWLRYWLRHAMASLRPQHSATGIAALVAGSGHPSGF